MLRLIDANLNRMAEGLRVLEDIARFYLDDADICGQLKTLRHELLESVDSVSLLVARRSEEDVGASRKEPGEVKREGLPQIVIANARRVQESLRVLEEFAKLADSPLTIDPLKLETARFSIYKLEQKLLFKLLRKEKTKRLKGLYLLLDTKALGARDPGETATAAIRGGVKVIQLRDKNPDKKELLQTARKLRKLCAGNGVLFIVNDYLDIARASGADGVHLGQGDLSIVEARPLLSPDMIIGLSTHSLQEAVLAESQGADYIALGSIYNTTSKEKFQLAGTGTLKQVREKTSLPLIAIGGINHTNVVEVIEAGVDGVAVISAVLGAENTETAARNLVNKIERSGKQE